MERCTTAVVIRRDARAAVDCFGLDAEVVVELVVHGAGDGTGEDDVLGESTVVPEGEIFAGWTGQRIDVARRRIVVLGDRARWQGKRVWTPREIGRCPYAQAVGASDRGGHVPQVLTFIRDARSRP